MKQERLRKRKHDYSATRVGGMKHLDQYCAAVPRMSPMIFAPTELALVNFDGLIRTTNLNRAALQKHQHGFAAEHAPVCDCMCTQAIFALDMVGTFAAHDVRDE